LPHFISTTSSSNSGSFSSFSSLISASIKDTKNAKEIKKLGNMLAAIRQQQEEFEKLVCELAMNEQEERLFFRKEKWKTCRFRNEKDPKWLQNGMTCSNRIF